MLGYTTTPQYRRARAALETTLDGLSTRAQRVQAVAYDAARGTLIRAARRLRVAAEEAVTDAVLTERAHGATWDDVAAALNEDVEFVREHYEPIEAARCERGGQFLAV